jgi:hypothetical protein
MKRRLVWLCLLSAATSGACAAAPETGETEDALDTAAVVSSRREMPIRTAVEQAAAPGGAVPAATSNGITYHGGPVMTGTVNLYYIWYGNWAGNSATTILTDLANTIGGSPYWAINTTYTSGNGTHLSNSVAFKGSTTDSYSQGTSLSDMSVATIVSNAIKSGKLPKDTNGVYFVLTSADVNETSGFCSKYCGWHSWTAVGLSAIKYAFVGNPDRCPSACTSHWASPNGNAGADGMATIIAHESEEAATDPVVFGWYDGSTSAENADKCVWTFGTTYTAANGAPANMKLGSRDFLIQRNWVNASGGYCDLQYPPPP